MKNRWIVAVGLLVLSAFTLSACPPGQPTASPGVTGDILSESELRCMKERAQRGDAEAAYNVAVHYESYPDQAEAIRWLTIAANLGHNLATQHLVVALTDRGGAACESGRAWLRRLDERVTDRHERELLGIDEMLRLERDCSPDPGTDGIEQKATVPHE